MMDIFVFIITTLGLGILCSIPGIFVGPYLEAKGIGPDRSRLVITSSIIGMFAGRLMLPDIPLVYIAVFSLIFSPLGVYRHNFWTVLRWGKGWWLKKEDERQPLFDLPTSLIISIAIGGVIVVLVFGVWILLTNLLPY